MTGNVAFGEELQGKNIIKVGEKERIEKLESPSHKNNEEASVGSFGVTGNAISLKGYLGQDTVLNNGIVHGQVDVTGDGTLEAPVVKDKKNGSIIIDGQGQGISLTSFTDVNNKRDAKSLIEKITNNGIIKGIANLKGGIASEWANVEAWTTGNGISSYSVVDFGIPMSGGGVDGSGGASTRIAAPKKDGKSSGSVSGDIHIDRIAEQDITGKNTSSIINLVENTGTIKGEIDIVGGKIVDGEYPEFASVEGKYKWKWNN